MSSLDIAPWPRRLHRPFFTQAAGLAPVSDVFPADVNFHLLEIGIQPVKVSPYHAGLPAHRPGHLDPATGFLACSCPRIGLSAAGKPSDPGTSLRVPPGYAGDTTKCDVAHKKRSILPRPCGRPGVECTSLMPSLAQTRSSHESTKADPLST